VEGEVLEAPDPTEEQVRDLAAPIVREAEAMPVIVAPVVPVGEVVQPGVTGPAKIHHPAADPNLRVQEVAVPVAVQGNQVEVFHRVDQRQADPAPGIVQQNKPPAIREVTHPAEKKAVQQVERKADK
jgi:hypothetical protein